MEHVKRFSASLTATIVISKSTVLEMLEYSWPNGIEKIKIV
jgi:hypothetical protein